MTQFVISRLVKLAVRAIQAPTSAKCLKMNPMSRLVCDKRGQTALEYMLMLAVIFSLLALVVAMTQYVDSVGATLGSTIDTTRAQVIDWILT